MTDPIKFFEFLLGPLSTTKISKNVIKLKGNSKASRLRFPAQQINRLRLLDLKLIGWHRPARRLPTHATGGVLISVRIRRKGLHDPRMSRLARAKRASDGDGPLIRVHADLAKHYDSSQIRAELLHVSNFRDVRHGDVEADGELVVRNLGRHPGERALLRLTRVDDGDRQGDLVSIILGRFPALALPTVRRHRLDIIR